MKKWMLFFGFLGLNLVVFGQNRFVGGDFSFLANKTSSKKQPDLNRRAFEVSINPIFGKIRGKQEVGFAVISKYFNSSNQLPNFQQTDFARFKGFDVGLQPFFRKKRRLFKNCDLFGELNLPILYSKSFSKYSGTFSFQTDVKRATAGIGVRAGVLYELHPRWRLVAQIGLLSVKYDYNFLENEFNRQAWVVQSSINTNGWFQFGINYLLENRPKSVEK
jgi:hypothetical protein